MSGFNTEDNGDTIPRADAKPKIVQMAKDQDIKGAFKVFYAGELVSNPDNLPDQVDMSKVRVSAVLDQAEGDEGEASESSTESQETQSADDNAEADASAQEADDNDEQDESESEAEGDAETETSDV